MESDKRDANWFLNFEPADIAVRFRDPEDRQIRGPQLDLILARLLRIGPRPSTPKTMDITQI
jgi:hypothetical protein